MAQTRTTGDVEPSLIYDVGVHVGEDTAYYLHKGYRVVGIEANPSLVEDARQRFEDEVRTGRLTLLNVGVAESPGKLDFYVCEDRSEWSSFYPELASREGARFHTVNVETRRFASILGEYGTPWYCKVDIEGGDRLCLEGLAEAGERPQYVSVEMGADADADIALLLELGYGRFKLVSQSARSQPLPVLAAINRRLPRPMSKVLRGLDRETRGKGRDGDWRFPRGSSGPFGEDTPGPWRTSDEVIAQWRYLQKPGPSWGGSGLVRHPCRRVGADVRR